MALADGDAEARAAVIAVVIRRAVAVAITGSVIAVARPIMAPITTGIIALVPAMAFHVAIVLGPDGCPGPAEITIPLNRLGFNDRCRRGDQRGACHERQGERAIAKNVLH